MSILNDDILQGRNDPTVDDLKSWTISGGSDAIESCLKDIPGWDADSLVASVGIHVKDDGGIESVQIFLIGFKDVGRCQGSILFGDAMAEEDYIKIDQVDMSLADIWDKLVSDWIPSDALDWTLKMFNPETKKYKVINKLDEEGLASRGASKFSVRAQLALDKGLKIICDNYFWNLKW